MDTAMSRYLLSLERRANSDIAEHLRLLRFGLPVAGCALAALAYWTLGNAGEYYQPGIAAGLSSAAAGLLGAGMIGRWFAERSMQSVSRIRAKFRRRLVDEGLLGLVLEPQPYDRLPSLRPLVPALLGWHGPPGEDEPLSARLNRLILNYEVISAEADSPRLLANGRQGRSKQRLQLNAPQMKLAFLAGCGLTMLGAAPPIHQAGPFGAMLSFALLGAGILIISQASFQGREGRIPAFGQSALETAALRLELAELLRAGSGGQELSDRADD